MNAARITEPINIQQHATFFLTPVSRQEHKLSVRKTIYQLTSLNIPSASKHLTLTANCHTIN